MSRRVFLFDNQRERRLSVFDRRDKVDAAFFVLLWIQSLPKKSRIVSWCIVTMRENWIRFSIFLPLDEEIFC
jgi:hypothetical protein